MRDPLCLPRRDHGLSSRASVASRPGSHEGECSGEVGSTRVSAGGHSRCEQEKTRAVSWARVPGFALLLSELVDLGLSFLLRRSDRVRPRSLVVSLGWPSYGTGY